MERESYWSRTQTRLGRRQVLRGVVALKRRRIAERRLQKQQQWQWRLAQGELGLAASLWTARQACRLGRRRGPRLHVSIPRARRRNLPKEQPRRRHPGHPRSTGDCGPCRRTNPHCNGRCRRDPLGRCGRRRPQNRRLARARSPEISMGRRASRLPPISRAKRRQLPALAEPTTRYCAPRCQKWGCSQIRT